MFVLTRAKSVQPKQHAQFVKLEVRGGCFLLPSAANRFGPHDFPGSPPLANMTRKTHC